MGLVIYIAGCILLHITELMKIERTKLKDPTNILNHDRAVTVTTYGRILLWPLIALAMVCLIPSVICIAFEVFVQGLYPVDYKKEYPQYEEDYDEDFDN